MPHKHTHARSFIRYFHTFSRAHYSLQSRHIYTYFPALSLCLSLEALRRRSSESALLYGRDRQGYVWIWCVFLLEIQIILLLAAAAVLIGGWQADGRTNSLLLFYLCTETHRIKMQNPWFVDWIILDSFNLLTVLIFIIKIYPSKGQPIIIHKTHRGTSSNWHPKNTISCNNAVQ